MFGDLLFAKVRARLEPRGVFISTIASAGRIARHLLTKFAKVKERIVAVRSRRADLEQLAAWILEGKLHAVIDSRFALAEVHEAFAVLESKHARGKIVIEIA